MDNPNSNSWLPPQLLTESGAERRVGVEVEFAGVDPWIAANCIQDHFGGELQSNNIFETHIRNTSLGDFLLELDTAYLKPLGQHLSQFNDDDILETMATELITRAAEQFVPWEIVSPPLPLSRLPEFQSLLEELRLEGALGTRHALHYAFGIHFNPELPRLNAGTILNYLRAYFCLYEWIVDQEQIDFARKMTPYIKHFDKSYVQKIVNIDYQPSLTELIDDYLEDNPTRNRSMDLLPLFTHLDEKRVRRIVKDDRVKSRPTLHYRLPNCDIDNYKWSLLKPWSEWLMVERLANNNELLLEICQRYDTYLDGFGTRFSNEWLKQTSQWIKKLSVE